MITLAATLYIFSIATPNTSLMIRAPENPGSYKGNASLKLQWTLLSSNYALRINCGYFQVSTAQSSYLHNLSHGFFFQNALRDKADDWCSQIFIFRHETISTIKVEEGEKEIRNATEWHFALENKSQAIRNRLSFHRGVGGGRYYFKYHDLHFILSFPKVSTQSLHSAGNSEVADQSKMCRNCFLYRSKTKQKPNNLIKQAGIRIFWLSSSWLIPTPTICLKAN